MLNLRPLLFGAALVATVLAHADPAVTGRFNLRVSEEAARHARLSGKDAPHGWLTLHVNGRFLLETESSVRHGEFRTDGNRLVLEVKEDGDVLQGEFDDDRLTLEGLVFERPNARPRDDAPLPLPPSERARPIIERPVFVPYAPRSAPRPAPRLVARDVVGIWTVWNDGVERKDERMELRRDGTFRFGMKGATSEGTWTVERGMIVLLYTKVDGAPLEDGASGRKEIPVSDDATEFRIDTFRYERATP